MNKKHNLDIKIIGCCPFVRSDGLHGEDCYDLRKEKCTIDIGQVTAAGRAIQSDGEING